MCRGADGVVVSADSRGHSLKGEIEDYDKLQLVGARVVVAEAGLLLVRDSGKTRFDVHGWVTASTRSLPARAPAAAVAKRLAEAAQKLRSLTSLPSVKRADRPQIILLVVGLDEVRRVIVDLKPFAVHTDVQSDPFVGVGLGPTHLEPQGVLFSLAARRRPELADPETLAARADFCGLLLAIESELNPLVAPPIRQIVLRSDGVERRELSPPRPASSPPPR